MSLRPGLAGLPNKIGAKTHVPRLLVVRLRLRLRAMKHLTLVLFTSLLVGGSAWADDQVRQIQEALRKRNLYFGEVDGRKTEETLGALRRYQQRQGLPPTGELNPPTLASLGIAPLPPGAVEWPEGPVLKSDAPRELPAPVQQRLEAQAAAATPVPVSEPPLPLELPPAPIASKPSAEETAPLVAFVRDYLTACASNHLADEMGFYAAKVSYFDHGTVNDEFIARDVQRYYKRWPNRRYELLDCKVSRDRNGNWETTFRIAFHYTDTKGKAANGKSVNIFKVRDDQGAMHFVSMKEQLVRE